jgi:hypothetical protein
MASKYWVGGGSSTNWSATAPTNWSLTSGGANNAAVPAATDDVFFNAASGAGASIISASTSIGSLDCTGFTGTLTHAFNQSLSLGGAGAFKIFKLVPGMTYVTEAGARSITFNGTGAVPMTMAGKTMAGITCNGPALTFQDAPLIRADGVLSLTLGTLDVNNFNVQCGGFTSTGTGVRTLNMGTGTWTLNYANNTGNIWDCTNSTNLTLNASTSTVVISATNTGLRNVFLGNVTYNNFTISNAAMTNLLVDITGSATLNNLTLTNCGQVRLSGVDTLAVNGVFTYKGVAPNLSLMFASTGVAAIALASAAVTDRLAVQNITRTGAGAMFVSNGIDSGGNTGITFSAPAGGGSTAKYWNGSAWIAKPMKTWDGAAWKQ